MVSIASATGVDPAVVNVPCPDEKSPVKDQFQVNACAEPAESIPTATAPPRAFLASEAKSGRGERVSTATEARGWHEGVEQVIDLKIWTSRISHHTSESRQRNRGRSQAGTEAHGAAASSACIAT
jgi:hypothetical protein